ncbi:MAG: hypothetical protein LQ342_002202 [Letrouitia transgressa]|nr:MAG: hypothetical protein LQ342_002202 [Letrouitia transgressa]
MAAPKRRTYFLRLFLTGFCILFSPAIFLLLLAYIFLSRIAVLPYTVYHFSANYGIRASDKPVVQKYLDRFEEMNPRLARKLSDVFRSEKWYAQYNGIPPTLKYWPHESKTEYAWFIVSASVTDYTFSVMAGLFLVLEERGFPRRLLWEFLKTQVETRSPRSVSDDEKREFRRVMAKMCTGMVSILIVPWKKEEWVRRSTKDSEGREMVGEKGFSLPESTPVGVQIVPLREGDGMEWLLCGKGLIVPMDWPAYRKAHAMTRFGLWGKVKKDMDLEDGKLAEVWQYMDLRVA